MQLVTKYSYESMEDKSMKQTGTPGGIVSHYINRNISGLYVMVTPHENCNR